MVWNPDSVEDFVNALHNKNVIDSLKYVVEIIENINEEDVSQCVNDANFVFTNAVRKRVQNSLLQYKTHFKYT